VRRADPFSEFAVGKSREMEAIAMYATVRRYEGSTRCALRKRLAARWVREQKLEEALPNTPKITAGPVIACEASGAAVTNRVAALA
jgi:hypothetical protein